MIKGKEEHAPIHVGVQINTDVIFSNIIYKYVKFNIFLQYHNII